jgi:PAS domain S-box-containing protein
MTTDRVLRILHLEDDVRDAELVAATLVAAGVRFEAQRVETRAEFEHALRTGDFDVIFSDYTLPAYDGPAALAFARDSRPEVPFILVSGTVGEDAAVKSMVGGATDYVLKDRLSRLDPALKRALREAENWRARKRAEGALHASEQQYRRLFEASKDGIILLDGSTGTILDANPSVIELLGHSRQEMLGKTIAEVGISGDDPETKVALGEIIAREEGRHGDLRLCVAGGRKVEVELVVSAYPVDGNRVVQLNLRDITERRHLEEELRQSQKLEAVGRLAGGVAHDFNNLLLVINNYTELALDTLGSAHPLHADLDEVRKAGVRAANLTRQLLAFSRKQILRPSVCCLNSVVGELEKMLRRVIGEDVQLRLRLAPELGNVRADPGQIEQVLVNLVVNSRDALETGGTICIETSNAEMLPEQVHGHADVTAGSYVCVSVADDGCGMSDETKARMFEPFFTTKGPGKGTGLGLSTVYGIVKQSGGHIEVDSQLGKGTVVRVYLPRQDGPLVASPPPERITGPAPRANETILLVEDDDSVRRLVRRVLAPLGYEVLIAESASSALAIVARRQQPIHLLLTDVVLPGMDGSELARKLTADRPGMKVIYMSGYTAEAVVRHGPTEPGAVVMQKPFTVAELTRQVRAVLSGTDC